MSLFIRISILLMLFYLCSVLAFGGHIKTATVVNDLANIFVFMDIKI